MLAPPQLRDSLSSIGESHLLHWLRPWYVRGGPGLRPPGPSRRHRGLLPPFGDVGEFHHPHAGVRGVRGRLVLRR